LYFDVLREVTGTLVAPSIAHGLADAVGEPLRPMFGWMRDVTGTSGAVFLSSAEHLARLSGPES
jgi:hypothetical protein